MVKIKVSKNQMVENYNHIIGANYCGLQNLLRYEHPRFYTSGVYGWNADIYEFGDTLIVTGYRPFGDSNYDIQNKYEKKAIELKANENGEYDRLIREFINEMKGANK